MHLAPPHVEIDIFKRYDTGKCLAQSAQLEDNLTCTSGRRVQHLCCHRGALGALEFAVLAAARTACKHEYDELIATLVGTAADLRELDETVAA
jgi:hypothetical protein